MAKTELGKLVVQTIDALEKLMVDAQKIQVKLKKIKELGKKPPPEP